MRHLILLVSRNKNGFHSRKKLVDRRNALANRRLHLCELPTKGVQDLPAGVSSTKSSCNGRIIPKEGNITTSQVTWFFKRKKVLFVGKAITTTNVHIHFALAAVIIFEQSTEF